MRTLLVAISGAVAIAAACAAPPGARQNPADLAGTSWRWVAFTTPVETVTVPDPERYTLSFSPEGNRVALRADCNRGAGGVSFPEPHRIALAALATTRAMCPPGSLGDRYVRELSRAAIWFLRDGDLFFDLPHDSGTMRFARAAP